MKKAAKNLSLCFLGLVFWLCVPSVEVLAQACAPAPVGLISWWAADSNVLDSRNRNNGTLVGNAGFAAGKAGQAFNLNNNLSNDDSVQITHDNNQNINGSFSAEAWIFPRSFKNLGPRIFDKDSAVPDSPRWLMALSNDGTVNSTVGVVINISSGVFAPNNSITLNQWHHVAFTYNPATGDLRLFLNGSLAASGNIGSQTVITTTTTPLRIGEDSTGTREFDGLIDEPAIYNRALSDTEITAIHAAGAAGKCKPTATVAPSGQVAWWAGDGNANDISGNNNNGTLQNGATFAVGKVGQTFNFTAQNQFVSIPNNPSLFPPTALSVEAWVNPSSYTGCNDSYRIFHTVQSALRGYVTAIDCSNQKFFGQLFNSSGAANTIYSNATIPVGTFTHIAMTWDGSNLRVYINGVLDNTVATTISTIGTNSDALRIGNDINFGFKGLIDEVSLNNRALTQEEITSTFNAGIAGRLKQGATAAGTSVVTNVGSDATINFSNVSAEGTTQQIPLDPAVLPALPGGFTGTGLFYDIATSASFTGNTTVCFNLPSFNSEPTFMNLKVMHLEGGAWVDRSNGQNFSSRTLCGQVSSLSPFAIAGGLAPTSADGTVAGRITDANDVPIAGVAVRMSGTQSRLTITDAEGNYRFDKVETNGFYTLTPERVNFTFSPSQRSFSQLGQLTEAAFTASANGGTLNPLDTTAYFVRQQYLDFLSREPDEAGFNFWVNNIEACGADGPCREIARANTSAAFFLSIEFRQTGYLVYRMYRSAYRNIPGAPVPVRLDEFRSDSQAIGKGVVVNKIGWEALLENNKQAFTVEFVERSRFLTAFPASITPAQFVDTLNQNAGNPLSQSELDQLVSDLTSGVKTRAQVLRAVAEDPDLNIAEFNRAFVLMQYFGYLRRNPNDAPEAGLNFDGYTFWLSKLEQFNSNYVEAEMVKAFITSAEYRQRFGL